MKNPTEFLEDFILNQEWAYQRLSDCEIATEVEAAWGDYTLQFFWQADLNILHINCTFGLQCDVEIKNEMYKLLALLNERTLLGHFELSDQCVPIYRNSLIVSSVHAIEQSLLFALEETDRFFPSINSVVLREKDAESASSIAILDTIGEA